MNFFSRTLKKAGIIHSVLNAKYHQQEAEIVARAGQRGAVTIATNMAGRGTDIKLGSGVADSRRPVRSSAPSAMNPAALTASCAGRCARQGDFRALSCTFFISLEDDLMRLFGSDRHRESHGTPGPATRKGRNQLEHPWLNRSIGQAQVRVEQHNVQIRKRTLEYDDVMNKQREVIYEASAAKSSILRMSAIVSWTSWRKSSSKKSRGLHFRQ